uniref:HECT domain-containing protein n=1 Tax=Stegastes partitus TaxID=144197 RepID=A0A3B4ZGV0_9TELE
VYFVVFHSRRYKVQGFNVVHALEQHASIFKLFPFLSSFMNGRFNITRFSDKLTGLSLADILMLATGLTSLPPCGMNPRPKLVFQSVPHFPCSSRTCANTMEIPLSVTSEEFQQDTDSGIQSSPGFGLDSCLLLYIELLGPPDSLNRTLKTAINEEINKNVTSDHLVPVLPQTICC